MPPPDAAGALRVAIVGAESTGKSALALALQAALAREFGLRCLCVGEFLREWCDARGRTPRADEQAAIAREQQRRIEAAAAVPGVDVVVCDTTPLMTTVYSELLFDDRSLDDFAAAAQRRADLTLLTALDLPWVADGLQRDGPHVRVPVDAAVRSRLAAWGVAWSLVSGVGEARTAAALDALRPLLRRRAFAAAPGCGLFRRLQEAGDHPPRPAWRCERCDDPGCEHLARRPGAR
jgi:nicotinamide riboside kinase